MSDLSSVKIGDKLFVRSRYTPGLITTVNRITPTGRVITSSGHTFESNGNERGKRDRWRRSYARPVTEDDIAGIYRAGLVSRLEQFRLWDKLSADDLKAVSDIIAKYEAAGGGK